MKLLLKVLRYVSFQNEKREFKLKYPLIGSHKKEFIKVGVKCEKLAKSSELNYSKILEVMDEIALIKYKKKGQPEEILGRNDLKLTFGAARQRIADINEQESKGK